MMTKQQAEAELADLFNHAAPHRQKEILENFEFQMARKSDVFAALQIADSIVHGSGKTKKEAREDSKRIKGFDALMEE